MPPRSIAFPAILAFAFAAATSAGSRAAPRDSTGLEQAEAVLGTLYERILDGTTDPEAMKADQTAWRTERDAGCVENAGGDRANERACRLHHTVERIADFEAALGVTDGATSAGKSPR